MGEYERIVVGMVNHKEAGKVVADAFELYAGEWERAVLVRGFYGKEVTLFESGFKAGSDEEKTKIKRGLKGLLEGLDIEKRKRILTSTKENLMTMYASLFSSKRCIDSPLFSDLTTPAKAVLRTPSYTEHYGNTSLRSTMRH